MRTTDVLCWVSWVRVDAVSSERGSRRDSLLCHTGNGHQLGVPFGQSLFVAEVYTHPTPSTTAAAAASIANPDGQKH